MKVREHNIETNEVIDRDATAKEIAEFEAIAAKTAAEVQARSEAAIVKAALLERLGITEEEAKLLLS